jgi:hypothetical protein
VQDQVSAEFTAFQVSAQAAVDPVVELHGQQQKGKAQQETECGRDEGPAALTAPDDAA